MNHFYSIKFSDFQQNKNGMLYTSISSAAYRTENGYWNIKLVVSRRAPKISQAVEYRWHLRRNYRRDY